MDNLTNISEQSSKYVTLKVLEQPKTTQISIRYETLNGNTPSTNGNFIGLWESDEGSIPLNTTAIWATKVDNDTTSSDHLLFNVPIGDNEYVLGYSQTGDPSTGMPVATNISATALISMSNFDDSKFDTISLKMSGNTMTPCLTLKLIDNMSGIKELNWIGIWENKITNGKDMIAKSPLSGLKIEGDAINLSSLCKNMFFRQRTYVLGYFAAGFNAESASCNIKHLMGYVKFTF